jgi:hypothetical protein
MTKRRVPDPELVDPATVPAPVPQEWWVYSGGFRCLVTTDDSLTIWRAPSVWRRFIGMHLSVLLESERATCSPVHQPDPPANRS